jgi:hypothetical protein
LQLLKVVDQMGLLTMALLQLRKRAITGAPLLLRTAISVGIHSSSSDGSRHPPTLHNTSLSNLVNSHFLDERWFDLHSLDNDFHFFWTAMWLARLFIANRPSAATAPAAAVFLTPWHVRAPP